VTKAEVFKRYLEEVWEKGNLASLDEFFSEDAAAVRTAVELFRAHHPNLHMDVLEEFEAEDKLVARLRAYSASKVAHGIVISRFAGERIAEAWAAWTDFE
jgi:aminoglycoside phosphotransferase family enzyme